MINSFIYLLVFSLLYYFSVYIHLELWYNYIYYRILIICFIPVMFSILPFLLRSRVFFLNNTGIIVELPLKIVTLSGLLFGIINFFVFIILLFNLFKIYFYFNKYPKGLKFKLRYFFYRLTYYYSIPWFLLEKEVYKKSKIFYKIFNYIFYNLNLKNKIKFYKIFIIIWLYIVLFFFIIIVFIEVFVLNYIFYTFYILILLLFYRLFFFIYNRLLTFVEILLNNFFTNNNLVKVTKDYSAMLLVRYNELIFNNSCIYCTADGLIYLNFQKLHIDVYEFNNMFVYTNDSDIIININDLLLIYDQLFLGKQQIEQHILIKNFLRSFFIVIIIFYLFI